MNVSCIELTLDLEEAIWEIYKAMAKAIGRRKKLQSGVGHEYDILTRSGELGHIEETGNKLEPLTYIVNNTDATSFGIKMGNIGLITAPSLQSRLSNYHYRVLGGAGKAQIHSMEGAK